MEDDKFEDMRAILCPPKDQQLLALPAATSTAAAASELAEAEAGKAADERKEFEAAAEALVATKDQKLHVLVDGPGGAITAAGGSELAEGEAGNAADERKEPEAAAANQT